MSPLSTRIFPNCFECNILMFWYAESSSYTTRSMSYSTSLPSAVGQYRSTFAPRTRAGSLGSNDEAHNKYGCNMNDKWWWLQYEPPGTYLLILVILPFKRAFRFFSSAFKSCRANKWEKWRTAIETGFQWVCMTRQAHHITCSTIVLAVHDRYNMYTSILSD